VNLWEIVVMLVMTLADIFAYLLDLRLVVKASLSIINLPNFGLEG